MMLEISNPYSIREPVRSADIFFGRSRELREIVQFLRESQSVSLVGPQGIGKTSLLLELMRPHIAADIGLGTGNLVCYQDCETLGGESPAGVYRRLAEALRREMKSRGLPDTAELRQAEAHPSRLAFESAVRALNRLGLKVAVLLDDFERLSANALLNVPFFNALRSAAGRLQIAYLTASIIPLIDLTYSANPRDILSSPFFNIFTPLRLGLLDEADARELIRQPSLQAGCPFSPEMQVFLHRLAGGHPMITQAACFQAWEHPDDRIEIEERTVRAMQPRFENLWGKLTEDERRILLGAGGAPVETSSTGPDAVVLRKLANQSLLIPSAGRYAYPGKVWADFLARQSPPSAGAPVRTMTDR
jgi:hypothetical protein